MARFIKLTSVTSGGPIYVNADNINYVFDVSNDDAVKTAIKFVGDLSVLLVTEAPEQILETPHHDTWTWEDEDYDGPNS